MKKLIILSVVILSGCALQNYHIDKAQSLCKDHGNIHSIQKILRFVYVTCNDGKILDVTEL